MKNFFASKVNWTGFLIIIVSLQDFIGTWNFEGMTTQSWVLFGLGILVVVIRTGFTSKAVTFKKVN